MQPGENVSARAVRHTVRKSWLNIQAIIIIIARLRQWWTQDGWRLWHDKTELKTEPRWPLRWEKGLLKAIIRYGQEADHAW